MFEKFKGNINKDKVLKKVFKEGKYFEYYEAKNISGVTDKVLKNDVYYETGSKKKAFRVTAATSFKRNATYTAILLVGLSIGINQLRRIEELSIQYGNPSKYESYMKYANREIDYVNKNDLSTLEVVEYLIDDMCEYVEGYKTPDMAIRFSYRYALGNNGYGVCRNFSDDLTYKLNQINPEYMATNVIVHGYFDAEDMDYKVVFNRPKDLTEHQEEVEEKDKKELSSFEKKVNKVIKSMIPNHMVTFIKEPNEDIVLVIDPTNAGVGVLLNGEIRMFNGNVREEKNIGLSLFLNSPKLDYNLGKLIYLSYHCPYTYEELESKYGLISQQELILSK